MVVLKNFLPKLYSILLIVFMMSTMGCYTRPKKSGILDFMNISNFVSYLTGTAFPLNVQVNGLTNSGTLVVELGSTGEQLTFSAAGSDSFSGYYDPNIVYTLSIITQPATLPTQTCIISNPNLTLTFASTTFVVNCAENWYKANVTVTGIDSANTTNLEIYNNGTDLKTRTSVGTVNFDVGDGMPYDITIGAVPTVPSTHICQVVTSPPNGTISGADVNLQISCLSLMKTSVPAAGSFFPSTKAMVFTFSGPVSGCSLDATAGGPPYSAGTASGSPGVTYSGNTAIVAPTALPWSFGALTFPLSVTFILTGCKDGVALANNGATISLNVKMMDGDVYFVRNVAGSDSNSCEQPNDACQTVQAAVSLCSSSAVCTIQVEGGVGEYLLDATTPAISITSSGGVRLFGSFDSAFSIQDMDATPTIIRDQRTAAQCAGTLIGTNECAAITITASGMGGDTKKAHVIQGFTIIADRNKAAAYAVKIVGGSTDSFAYIAGNYISGGEVAGDSTAGGSRGGIYLLSSVSQNQIDMNVIKGGFGADNSVAVQNYNSHMLLTRNRLSGDKAGASSTSVLIANTASNPTLAIINNTMNYLQYTDATVTSSFAYGMRADETPSSVSNFYVAGNSVYANGGSVNNGLFFNGASASNAQVLNNLVKVQGSNNTCVTYATTPSGSAIFRGNNIDCTAGTKLMSNSVNFPYYCPNGTFNSFSTLCLLANAFLDTTRGGQNFNDIPSFTSPPPLKPWLSFSPANGGTCNIAFGGVETSSYLSTFDTIYKQDAVIGSSVSRTTSSGGTTPSGSAGYSIGAFELDDAGCL
ncbi:hypothetical protein EHQ52_01915 [Leptospira koniambonensis]|uniref:Lipoprotein n=1 Tax=Leptospira koniambonensis TaxID=2484950 RepID=A0A4R9JB46_9LEPT|nr:hypothetical protein [Leptospira koniambonensis]TGL36657.1 hypothetical protein EHQ52_01915 [Leptospira koniambonensis]